MKISDSLAPFFVMLTLLATASGAENTIRGIVRNGTTGQPAANEAAILVRLDGVNPDIQEKFEASTHTDSQGRFTFPVQRSGEAYLVRVIHQSVIYDQPVSVGDSVSIGVFDAAPQVQGITGNIEILRLATRVANNQKLLHVSDMYEIRNDSNPPVTLAGSRTFEVYLPQNATIDSVLASGPAPLASTSHDERQPVQDAVQNQKTIGVMISVSTLPGQPGHYSVNFPLRPGATRFAFNYDLPYEGHVAFHPRLTYGFHQLAVMIPPLLQFSSRSSAFTRLPVSGEYQVEAVGSLNAGAGPAFEVSGNGSLPVADSPPPAVGSPRSTAPTSGGSPARAERVAASHGYDSPNRPWLILIGSVVAASALLTRRVRARIRRKRTLLIGRAKSTTIPIAQSLKEELFQLETDRIRGVISADEYASARQTLEESVKRMVA